MTDARVVLVTAPDRAAAERLVDTLLEERLIACGNLVPGVQSIYRWNDAVQRESEVLLVLKTTAARVPTLLQRVPALHPYDVPEVLVIPVEAGHGPYLEWVHQEIGSAGRP